MNIAYRSIRRIRLSTVRLKTSNKIDSENVDSYWEKRTNKRPYREGSIQRFRDGLF